MRGYASKLLNKKGHPFRRKNGISGRFAGSFVRQGRVILLLDLTIATSLAEIARAGRYLGIANLITLFVPELIVLSGSVMNSVELMPSLLRGDAPLIRAGVVWAHRYAWEQS